MANCKLFYHNRKRCWSLSEACAKGQGVLVEKAFYDSLFMTDDLKLPPLTDDWL